MKLFVIGRILGSNGKVQAYKIYNEETQKSDLIARADVSKHMIDEGIKIIGLKIANKNYNTQQDAMSIRTVMLETKNVFLTGKVDRLNGKGISIDEVKHYVVMGVRGFEEAREFKCVGSDEKVRFIEYAPFIKLIEEDRIIGAVITNEKLHLFPECKEQLYS